MTEQDFKISQLQSIDRAIAHLDIAKQELGSHIEFGWYQSEISNLLKSLKEHKQWIKER